MESGDTEALRDVDKDGRSGVLKYRPTGIDFVACN